MSDDTSKEKCAARTSAGLQEGYARVCLKDSEHTGCHSDTWHADDCGGTCDGCGHIAADGFWYNAPCPDDLLRHQLEWAENGAPNAVRAE